MGPASKPYIMPPPRFQKKGKGKKKIVDPFEKKDWYNIKAPRFFPNTNAGVTPVNRTSGNNIASDNLKGRVVTINLADLQKNEKYGYANIKLKVDEVQGKQCLTNFYGLTYTTDKLKELVKKLVHNSMGESIIRQVQGIYPMRDIGIRKVKLIKAPRYDPAKLLELHGEGKRKAGKKVKA